MAGGDFNIDMRDVEGWGREPGRIIHGGSARAFGRVAQSRAVLLRYDQEPRHREGGRVRGVDQRVADVKRCESQAVEGGLRPDVWCE